MFLVGLVAFGGIRTGFDGKMLLAALAVLIDAYWCKGEGRKLYLAVAALVFVTSCLALLIMAFIEIVDARVEQLWILAEYWPRARWDVARLSGLPWKAELMRTQFGVAVFISVFASALLMFFKKLYDQQIDELLVPLRKRNKVRFVAVLNICLALCFVIFLLLERDSDADIFRKDLSTPFPVALCVGLPLSVSLLASGILLLRRDREAAGGSETNGE
jgi:hypothetical protein